MKKSVYSLVLMDDVIKAVDEEAYRLGTSRSNLINQILAQHLSCTTPEMRMQEIFSAMTGQMERSFRIQQQRSLMVLKTALDYKYRPTISYKVSLERVPEEYLGTLTVQLRSQNTDLCTLFGAFFTGWSAFESNKLKEHGCTGYCASLDGNTFTRKLLSGGTDDAGEAISDYLKLLNSAVQRYFSSPSDVGELSRQLEREYEKMLGKFVI